MHTIQEFMTPSVFTIAREVVGVFTATDALSAFAELLQPRLRHGGAR